MTSQIVKAPPSFARASFRQRHGWGLSECLFFCVAVLALAAVLWCGRFTYREGVLLEGAKANGQAIARWADGVAAAHAKGEPFAPQECSALLMPPPPPPEAAASVLPEGTPVESAAVDSAEARMVPVSLVMSSPPLPAADTDQDKGAAQDSEAVAAKTAERAPPTWQACREALFAASGPFAKLSNPFDATNTVLGTKCERKSAATRGHVLVEKGTSPPPGVTGSVSWSPLEDKELIAKGLLLRVQVCDAGGYAVKVAEVTL